MTIIKNGRTRGYDKKQRVRHGEIFIYQQLHEILLIYVLHLKSRYLQDKAFLTCDSLRNAHYFHIEKFCQLNDPRCLSEIS